MSPSMNLVTDAFVAGSLHQAVFTSNGAHYILEGSKPEPRTAQSSNIELFRHAAFEIKPAHPKGGAVSMDRLKHLLEEEIAFFQGLDGILVGMDCEMSSETRARGIARAEQIIGSNPSIACRIRQRLHTPINAQDWDPHWAMEHAVEQGAIQAQACYEPLVDSGHEEKSV